MHACTCPATPIPGRDCGILTTILLLHGQFLHMAIVYAGVLFGLWGLPISPVRTIQILIIRRLEISVSMTSRPPGIR